MAIIRQDYGTIGGGGITFDNIEVVQGRVTIGTTSTYTFTKDYKIVELNTWGSNNARLYRLNNKEALFQAEGAGSQYGASYPTSTASYLDVKAGDVLSLSSGSLTTTIIGYY